MYLRIKKKSLLTLSHISQFLIKFATMDIAASLK